MICWKGTVGTDDDDDDIEYKRVRTNPLWNPQSVV